MTGNGALRADAIFDGGDRRCGELVLAVKLAVERLAAGQVLMLVCRDPAAREDLPAWCRITGHRLLGGDGTTFYIQRKGV